MISSSFFLLLIFNTATATEIENSFNVFNLPTLNLYDNFQECLGLYPGGDYCVVDTMIKPDYDSKLYNEIIDYNKDVKKHFRRDMLTRGLCIERCNKIIAEIQAESENFIVEEFPRNVTVSCLCEFINKFTNENFNRFYSIQLITQMLEKIELNMQR